jgi:hypothetical protein
MKQTFPTFIEVGTSTKRVRLFYEEEISSLEFSSSS